MNLGKECVFRIFMMVNLLFPGSVISPVKEPHHEFRTVSSQLMLSRNEPSAVAGRLAPEKNRSALQQCSFLDRRQSA
jgi:hypothetical protein